MNKIERRKRIYAEPKQKVYPERQNPQLQSESVLTRDPELPVARTAREHKEGNPRHPGRRRPQRQRPSVHSQYSEAAVA